MPKGPQSPIAPSCLKEAKDVDYMSGNFIRSCQT